MAWRPAESSLAIARTRWFRFRRKRQQVFDGPSFGEPVQLSRVFEAELRFDVLAMRLNCFDAQVKLAGDFARRLGCANELEHLQLAIREPLNSGARHTRLSLQ
jgi:hypothetical protein